MRRRCFVSAILLTIGLTASCSVQRQQHGVSTSITVSHGIAKYNFILATRQREFFMELHDKNGKVLKDEIIERLSLEITNRSHGPVMINETIIQPGEMKYLTKTSVDSEGVAGHSYVFYVSCVESDYNLELAVTVNERLAQHPSDLTILTVFEDGA